MRERKYKKILGSEAEELAYIFGAHVKESLWENLNRNGSFRFNDRLKDETVEISEGQFKDLVILTLAN